MWSEIVEGSLSTLTLSGDKSEDLAETVASLDQKGAAEPALRVPFQKCHPWLPRVEVEQLVFKDFNRIGYFLTDVKSLEKRADEMEVVLPWKVLPMWRLLKLRGTDLTEGYDPPALRTVFEKTIRKQCFLKWLADHDYFKNNTPHFVSNVRRLKTFMKSVVVLEHNWSVYALKINGSIFLSSGSANKEKVATKIGFVDFAFNRRACGLPLTEGDGFEFNDLPSAVSEIRFGGYKILLSSGGEAEDKEGSVQIRIYKKAKRHPKEKLFDCWAESAVSGKTSCVLGALEEFVLTAVEKLSLDELWKKTSFGSAQRISSYMFTKEMLDFISKHMQDQNDGDGNVLVKRFWIECSKLNNSRCVRFETVEDEKTLEKIMDLVLPEWFRKKAFDTN